MNSVIAWFAENRVAANLLMILTLVAGGLSISDTQKETFPNIALDMVIISVGYPGASPSEVESGVVRKVEEAIADLQGVAQIDSSSMEAVGIVKAKVAYGFDGLELKQQIRSRVDGIRFPENASRPIITQMMIKDVVGNVVVSGNADERTLKRIAENVRTDLLKDPMITQVQMANVRPYEISIQVSEISMQRYGISFAEVTAAIKRQSIDIPVGVIQGEFGNTTIVAQGEVDTKDKFEEIIIYSQPDGGRVYLRDVATIIDGFQQGSSRSEYNGEPAVYLSVFRVGSQNILSVSEAIYKYVDNPTTYLPEGIKIGLWNDASRYFRDRIDLLSENAVVGLSLVFIILMLFLRWRLSFWVSLGIPISFMGAFWMLPIFGGSINMISLFAFILVLGIVVDDAIIVGENIFTHQKAGRTGLSGAISGAQEVASPVVFAVLTTIVMFSPLLFLPGPEGKMMFAVPLVVIATLMFSLLESLLILPAHLSEIKPRKPEDDGFLGRSQQKFENWLERFITNRYQPFINIALQWRYTVISVFVALFILAGALLSGGWIKTVLFSEIEADFSVANITFAKGNPASVTKAAIKKMENAALDLKAQLKEETGEEQIQNILTMYGTQLTGGSGDHLGSVIMEMAPSENRELSGAELDRRWRELVGDIPDVLALSFDSTFNKPGPAIDIRLTHQDPDILKDAADKLKVHLSEYDGVYDITDTHARGLSEIGLKLKPMAADLQIKLDSVAQQVRQAFHGTEVQRVQRDGEEVSVVVRYPPEERVSLWYLENMNIRLPDRSSVPLLTIADIEYGAGPAVIARSDRKRTLRVQAYVDPAIADSSQILSIVKKDFMPSITVDWSLAGVQKAANEFTKTLLKGYVIALLVMYILMATLFKSYLQPAMVMFAIPSGLIGAIVGHLIVGIDVTLWSLIGMVAVSGVVVNDNLVMVDYINRKRRAGVEMIQAIRESGAARFRPIVLTSATTFVGLAPLMLESSVQAQFLIPMAVSLAFGVLFATFVTLILVPSSYYILEDLKGFTAKFLPEGFFENQTAEGLSGLANVLKAANEKIQGKLSAQPEPVLEGAGASLNDATPVSDLDEQHSSESESVEPELVEPESTDDELLDSDNESPTYDSAYDSGYEEGLKGVAGLKAPSGSEEFSTRWEAGYEDGIEAYELKRQL